MIAVVAGASGLVGSHLLQKLLRTTEIHKVICVGRRSLGLTDEKLQEVLIADLSLLKEKSKELAGDLYFCCLGTTIKEAGSQKNFEKVDLQAVCEFGEIAKNHSARCLVVVSASGASKSSRIFYSRTKGKAESYLRSLNLNRLVIIKPSLLVGERKNFRAGEAAAVLVMKNFGPLMPRSIRKRLMSRAEDVAQKMLEQSQSLDSGIQVIEATEI